MSVNAVGSILPNGLVPLSSQLGQQMLNEVPFNQKDNQMVEMFKSQQHRMFAGPASLALLVSAINVVYRIKLSEFRYNTPEFNALIKRLYAGEKLQIDENELVNLKATKSYFKEIGIETNGMTLLQLESVASTMLKFGVLTYFADNQNTIDNMSKEKRKHLNVILKEGDKKSFLDAVEFRKFMSSFYGSDTGYRGPVQGLIVNYDMSLIGYKNGVQGHFSPIAAYHKGNDSVLVMDVWAENKPAWIKTELLYKAMATIDNASGLPRGLLKIYEVMM